jgi:hypothetical protein
MSYSDIYLQDHELNYWINGFNPPLHHQHFYNEFFPFKELNLKKVIEIGCGGSPITDYNQITPELTLVDPLLDKLLSKLEIFFSIEKIDKNINPTHMGPFTDSSIRLIAVKK